MDLDAPQSDRPSRIRLLDIRVDDERGPVHFAAHLSGILAAPADRSEAAHRIATTLVGPRPEGAGGSVECDGEVVSVWALPGDLLPDGAPALVGAAVVHAQWRAWLGRQREKVAAAHASCRLEGYRIDAALEQARDRLPLPGAPAPTADPRPPPVVPRPRVAEPEPEPEAAVAGGPVDWAHPPDASVRTRAQLRALLDQLDATKAVPLPEAVLLADAWDAHTVLVRARAAADAAPVDERPTDIDALEERVNAARAAIENAPQAVADDVRAGIEQCHRTVVEAEAGVFEAKRRHRAAAQSRYDEALARELAALAEAGFESYAAFRFEVTGGNAAAGLAARLAAETELAVARSELDAARQVPAVPTRLELDAREAQMRARAAELLGRAPGSDPVADLRGLFVDTGDRDEIVADLADVLDHGGVPCTGDVVECARAFVARPPRPAPRRPRRTATQDAADEPMNPLRRAAREAAEAWGAATGSAPCPEAAPNPEPPPLAVPTGTVDPARWREVADLEEQRAAQNRKLAAFEAELARIDGSGDARPRGAELGHAFEQVLVDYRAGGLLGGRLPLILDGVLDGLTLDARDAALQVFARADDVQTVVVTDDPEVMQHLAREGGTLVRWPQRLIDLTEESEHATAPTRGA